VYASSDMLTKKKKERERKFDNMVGPHGALRLRLWRLKPRSLPRPMLPLAGEFVVEPAGDMVVGVMGVEMGVDTGVDTLRTGFARKVSKWKSPCGRWTAETGVWRLGS
jgi:hypothetical protein